MDAAISSEPSFPSFQRTPPVVLWTVVVVSAALHLGGIYSGALDGLAQLIFGGGPSLQSKENDELTVDVILEIPEEQTIIVDGEPPQDVQDPIETEAAEAEPPKLVPLPPPPPLGNEFVFVPNRDNPRAGPLLPTPLVSDRNVIAKNDTKKALPVGEAFSEGNEEEHRIVEVAGSNLPPGARTHQGQAGNHRGRRHREGRRRKREEGQAH